MEVNDEKGVIRKLRLTLAVCVLAMLFLVAGVVWWHFKASAPKILAEKENKINSITAERNLAITEKTNMEATITKERLAWEKERSKAKLNAAKLATELQRNIDEIATLNATLMTAKDERDRKFALRLEFAEWVLRIRKKKARLENHEEISDFEWKAFIDEFGRYAKQVFTKDQLILLDSDAGTSVPAFVPMTLVQNEDGKLLPDDERDKRKSKWITLHRWEARLSQYIQALSYPQ